MSSFQIDLSLRQVPRGFGRLIHEPKMQYLPPLQLENFWGLCLLVSSPFTVPLVMQGCFPNLHLTRSECPPLYLPHPLVVPFKLVRTAGTGWQAAAGGGMFIRESELAQPAGRPIDREAEHKWLVWSYSLI